MRHEKIFKREDGKQYQISIDCHLSEYSADKGMRYSATVWYRDKGKKKWLSLIDRDNYTWRKLSMKEREEDNFNKYLEHVTREEMQEVAIELWNKLKPGFDLS